MTILTIAASNPPPPHASPLLAHPEKNIAATNMEKITMKISVSRKLGLVIAANAARLFQAEGQHAATTCASK
jgi:hypothetical protein